MPKRLVVCSDGTWNTPEDRSPTNVIRVARSLLARDAGGRDQVVFYDRGIGTGGFMDRYAGGITGKGLNANIQDGYRFLVHNYARGDEIFLFGFSRGAYTVRSLVGLIRNCGLLRKASAARIPEAFEMYKSRLEKHAPDETDPSRFIAAHAHRGVTIRFLGVWDTVGALGVPVKFRKRKKYMFHDTTLSSIVEHAYHALALDEKRRLFKPTVWNTRPGRENTAQVWFAGAHSDVGGGYDESWGLSDIALVWMLDRAHHCGLRVDTEILRDTFDDGEHYWVHDSSRGIGEFRKGLLQHADERVHVSVRQAVEMNHYVPRNLPADWQSRLDTWQGPLSRDYART